jgi:CMP-N,N'-diacetyllegionaminic acid synthase
MTEKYLAIVTARSGSKRLPDKNVRDFCGKPLFVWSVLAGRECLDVGETVVSTDCSQYQALALAAGAKCARLRPPYLATDTASSFDVVKDVLDHFGRSVAEYKSFVLLQPTSPLRTAIDVSAAIALHRSRGAVAVVSVCEAECPPAWIGQIGEDLRMDDFIRPEYKGMRSQDLGTWYRVNGAIYVVNIEAFLRERSFTPRGTVAYVMPRDRSVDVDTAYEFKLAEALMSRPDPE